MSKRVDAIDILMREANSKRLTKAGYQRVLKALDVLGFTDPMERLAFLHGLEYVDYEGKLHDWLLR